MKDADTSRRGRARIGWFVVLVGLTILAGPTIAPAGSVFHTRIAVSPQGLEIIGEFFRKAIPMSDLQIAGARIVDLDREPGLRPWLKLYGVGLPGYRSGWYRLHDRQKAVVAVARSNLAVYIPTAKSYAVLVGPDDPAGFLAALQHPADGGRVFTVQASH